MLYTNYQLPKGKKQWKKWFALSQSDIEILISKCQDDEEFIYEPSDKARNKTVTDYCGELEDKKTKSELKSYIEFIMKVNLNLSCPFCLKAWEFSKIANREVMLKLFCIWRNFQQSFGPNRLFCFDPGQIRTKLLHFHSDLENFRDQFLFNSLLITFF